MVFPPYLIRKEDPLMLNRVILIGRVATDPTLRHTQTQTPVANFRIAVDRQPNKNGERIADFFDVIAWQKLAENVAKNLTKGRLVAVEGRLQSRKYQTQDNQTRVAIEVIAQDVRYLDRKPNADAEAGDLVAVGADGDGDYPF